MNKSLKHTHYRPLRQRYSVYRLRPGTYDLYERLQRQILSIATTYAGTNSGKSERDLQQGATNTG